VSVCPKAALTALAIALVAAPAAADPDPVRFAWVRARGADACASQEQIAEQVAARLGRSPFAGDAARSIEAIVTRDARGFHAEIYERSRDGALAGMRALSSEAATCAPIEDASVLAIALAIDPEAGLRPLPPRRPPAPIRVSQAGVGTASGCGGPPAKECSGTSTPSHPPQPPAAPLRHGVLSFLFPHCPQRFAG